MHALLLIEFKEKQINSATYKLLMDDLFKIFENY